MQFIAETAEVSDFSPKKHKRDQYILVIMMMMTSGKKIAVIAVLISAFVVPWIIPNAVSEQMVPEWIKNTAKWYGDGLTTEADFLNAIKFLIENDILIINGVEQDSGSTTVIIPNGNALQGNIGYYIPLNLQIKSGDTVMWQNNDANIHTVQSQDLKGNPTGLFTSSILETGDTFEFQFTESGEYHYYCTLHPWRVGVITVK